MAYADIWLKDKSLSSDALILMLGASEDVRDLVTVGATIEFKIGSITYKGLRRSKQEGFRAFVPDGSCVTGKEIEDALQKVIDAYQQTENLAVLG